MMPDEDEGEDEDDDDDDPHADDVFFWLLTPSIREILVESEEASEGCVVGMVGDTRDGRFCSVALSRSRTIFLNTTCSSSLASSLRVDCK